MLRRKVCVKYCYRYETFCSLSLFFRLFDWFWREVRRARKNGQGGEKYFDPVDVETPNHLECSGF